MFQLLYVTNDKENISLINLVRNFAVHGFFDMLKGTKFRFSLMEHILCVFYLPGNIKL